MLLIAIARRSERGVVEVAGGQDSVVRVVTSAGSCTGLLGMKDWSGIYLLHAVVIGW